MHKPRPGSRRRRPSPARRCAAGAAPSPLRAAAVPPPDEAADEEGEEGEDKFVGPWGEARAGGAGVEPAESVGEEGVNKEERGDLAAAFADLGRPRTPSRLPGRDELLLLDQCSPAPTPTWMTLARSKGGMAAISGGKMSSHLPIYPFELNIINKIKNIIYYLRN